MTEKIIDGVDVAKCVCFADVHVVMTAAGVVVKEIDKACVPRQKKCSDLKKCLFKSQYKQLKRLKQENERLKEQYNCYACGNCQGKEDYINLEKHHKGLRKQFDKYHKALAEIKEIAENIVNNDDKPSCVNDDDCPLNGGVGYDNHCNMKCPFILGKQILQKISEVME